MFHFASIYGLHFKNLFTHTQTKKPRDFHIFIEGKESSFSPNYRSLFQKQRNDKLLPDIFVGLIWDQKQSKGSLF